MMAADSTRLHVAAAWCVRHERAWRYAVVTLAAAIFVAQGVHAVRLVEDGDFFLHWQFADHFLKQEMMYKNGLHVPYLPFWGLAWTPITLLSITAAKAVCFTLSLPALAALLYLLDRLTRRRLPLAGRPRFWVTALTLFLVSRFVIRELPECGPNLALLALVWLAVYLWTRGRDVRAGLCLGLAMALKCTPGLFLLYFACKRQWKLAAVSLLAAAACTLAPALWLGSGLYAEHVGIWWSHIERAAGDPTRNVLGEETLKNLALRPALARLLIRLPPGHASRIDHPLYAEFLNLAPWSAKVLIIAGLGALLATAAWTFRRRIRDRDDLAIVWECASVSVLTLLVSPITWGQHCVGLIPAFYLLARTVAVRGRYADWMNAILIAFATVNLVFNRGLVGRDAWQLLSSYHLVTWSLVGVFALTLAARARELREATFEKSAVRQPAKITYSVTRSLAPRPNRGK